MQNARPEVLVTGTGVVTCLGASLEATLDAARRGGRVRGIPVPPLCGTPYEGYTAAGEPEIDLPAHVPDRRMRKFMSRHAELAAVAARQALEEAAPHTRGIAAERMGLYAGVGLAAVDIRFSTGLLRASLNETGAFSLGRFAREGLRTIHPLWSFHTLANMPACIVSILEGIKGDNGIYTPWEDQTAFALLEAAHALARGDIDCAVVVASDTPAHPASLVELASAGYISPHEIAASGAACLVLERPDSGAPQRPCSRLRNLRLEALPAESAQHDPKKNGSGEFGLPSAPRIHDPLAPLIGRTVAAAPLLLAALAGPLGLPCRLDGCGGHSFTFEVA